MVNVFLVCPTGILPGPNEGSPVFPTGTFRIEIRLPFISFLSFLLVSCGN